MKGILLLFLLMQQTCSSVDFGQVISIFNLNTTFPTSSSNQQHRKIRFIQRDRDNPENFLIGIDTALLSVPLLSEDTSRAELIVGNIDTDGYNEGVGSHSRFSDLSSLVQTSTGYIVTDIWNHCLRLIQPVTHGSDDRAWQTSTYAGKCGVIGSADGQRFDARFHLPEGMIERDDVLYIIDRENRKLRQLDIYREEVTTIHEFENFVIRNLAFGSSPKEFFVTSEQGILQTEGKKETWLVGCSEATHDKFAKTKFSSAGFDNLQKIAEMGDNVLLVADQHVVRVVDKNLQEVDVICAGQKGYLDGGKRSCELTYATSIAVLDDSILIGELNTIRRVPYYFSNSTADTAGVDLEGKETSTSQIRCGEPPRISNSRDTVPDSYMVGGEIYYQCIDSYMMLDANQKLTCTLTGGRAVWSGNQLECQPSTALVAVMITTSVYIIILLALVLVIVKLCRERKNFKNKECNVSYHGYMVPPPSQPVSEQSMHNLAVTELPAVTDVDYETVNEQTVSPPWTRNL